MTLPTFRNFKAPFALLCVLLSYAIFSDAKSSFESSQTHVRSLQVEEFPCKPSEYDDWTYNYNCDMEVDGQVAPEEWGELYEECDGMRQSPINFASDAVVTNCGSAPIKGRFDFSDGRCDFERLEFETSSKGWTVSFGDSCEVAPHIEIDGKVYNLLQFHLHSVSEHDIDGESFDAELHMVHVDAEDENNLAVIGVMVSSAANNIGNEELTKYWTALTNQTNEAESNESEQVTMTQIIRPYDMLPPDDGTYFTYLGSLTTPPCTESVTWIMMQQGIAISQEQLGAFRNSIKDVEFSIVDSYGNNNRPLQRLHDRTVFQCVME